MKLSDKKGVQQIVSTLAKLGLKDVVICPGSRNAPFIMSFNRHGGFHCVSIRDERSAGFFALGKIIETRKPAAIVCTSGSAAVNFAPAISEAFYQRLPLLVITADRPKEWIGQGDGQTINQTDIYKNYIRAFYELNGDAFEDEALWYNSRSLCEGFAIATAKDAGPVHFNVALKEPLYGEADIEDHTPKIFFTSSGRTSLEQNEVIEFQKTYSEATRVMILVGQKETDTAFAASIKKIPDFENTVVLTESTSNIHDKDFIENIDRCITTLLPEEAASYMPDLLITVGGAVVSKRIKALLRKYKPAHHWNIDPYDAFMDTYQSLTDPVFVKPEIFFGQLSIQKENITPGYKQLWLQRKQLLEKLHRSFSGDVAYSDFFAFNKIMKAIPADTHLHLSNSSPIRYAQLFDNSNISSSWSNRGTSGIDGCTSTAIGAASASPDKQFVLVTGDVAFYYDINALWNEVDIENLKIILINNGGGGIFRIISGENAKPEMETFFETAQQRNAAAIAAAYHWNYLAAKDEDELENTLKQFFSKDQKRTILEIFTPADKNPEVLQQYWNYLKENSKP